MTQSNEQGGDEQLRKHIEKRVGVWFGEPVIAVEDELLQLILADRKQHELDARENELDQINTLPPSARNMTVAGHLVKRYAELKAEREAR